MPGRPHRRFAKVADNMTDTGSVSKAPSPDEVVMPQERRFQVGEREIILEVGGVGLAVFVPPDLLEKAPSKIGRASCRERV